jgi:hypothetical protein
MILRVGTAVLTALMLMSFAAPDDALARRGGKRNWELLGKTDVGFLTDKDSIKVGRKDGDFSAIKVRVRKNDVNIVDMKVIYANGKSDDIPLRSIIKAGGESRTIDLKGGDRFIRRIDFVYRSKPSFKGQATVEVWGKD